MSTGRSTSIVCGMSGSLRGAAEDDECALGAGYGALDEDDALGDVDGVHREVLRRDLLAAHVAGHAQALEDATRSGAGADRTGLAVVAVRTVRSADAVETVALHDAGEALALAGGGDVDDAARGEDLRGDL